MLNTEQEGAIPASNSGFKFKKTRQGILNGVELGTREKMPELNVQRLPRRVLVECFSEPSDPWWMSFNNNKKDPTQSKLNWKDKPKRTDSTQS